MIKLIAMTDINNGIGDSEGNLLYDIKEDMQHFIETTKNHVVVMGRKTWDTLKVKPLPNRENIVMTRNKDFSHEGVKTTDDINEILELAKERDVFIIGGEEIYNLFFDYADELHITHVRHVNQKSATFFPEYGVDDWKIVNLKKGEHEKPTIAFAIYKRVK